MAVDAPFMIISTVAASLWRAALSMALNSSFVISCFIDDARYEPKIEEISLKTGICKKRGPAYLCRVYNYSCNHPILRVVAILAAVMPLCIHPVWPQSNPATTGGLIAEALAPFESDFAEIRLDGKRQYLHRSGRVTVDKPEQYGAPICIAVKNGAYGAINRKGDVIADFDYDRIYYEYEDTEKTETQREYLYFLAVVQRAGKYGAVDTLGHVVAQPIYEELQPINGLVIAAQKSGKWGLLSLKDGRMVLPFEYDGLKEHYGLNGCIEVTVGKAIGLRSADGQRELIPPAYQSLRVLPLSTGAIITAKQDTRTRLLGTLGQIITEVDYDDLQAEGERIRVEKDGKRGWLTAQGTVMIPPAYDESSEWRAGRCVVSQGNMKGVINADGKIVLPCQYGEIRLVDPNGSVSADPVFIRTENAGKWGLFDINGQPILPMDYDDIRPAQAGTVGYIWAATDGKYGIFDSNGKELLPFGYPLPTDGYRPSVQGISPASIVALPDGDRIGLYDLEQRQWILPPEYEQIEWQLGAFIKATNRKGANEGYEVPISAYFTSDGTELIAPTEYLFADAVDTDRYVVKTLVQGYWKTELFDRSGKPLYTNKDWEFDAFRFNKLLVPDSVSIGQRRGHFQNGWLKISAEDNLFVDRSGREHRFDSLDYVGDFYNGQAIATKQVNQVDHIGMIDSAGNILLPLVYTDIDKLYDSDLLLVSKAGKAGLVDSNGKVIVEAQYDRIDRTARKDLFEVQRDGKKGIVDDKGRTILPLEYEEIQFHDTFFVVTAQGKKGFLTPDGQVLAPPQYEEVRLNNSYSGYFPALVQRGDHWTYIDPTDTGQSFHIIGKTKLGY